MTAIAELGQVGADRSTQIEHGAPRQLVRGKGERQLARATEREAC
jgi:hypothetical protein